MAASGNNHIFSAGAAAPMGAAAPAIHVLWAAPPPPAGHCDGPNTGRA